MNWHKEGDRVFLNHQIAQAELKLVSAGTSGMGHHAWHELVIFHREFCLPELFRLPSQPGSRKGPQPSPAHYGWVLQPDGPRVLLSNLSFPGHSV